MAYSECGLNDELNLLKPSILLISEINMLLAPNIWIITSKF
jgi:predicted ATP-binding protein involved in virulence